MKNLDFVLIARQLKMGNIGEQLARAAFRDCDKNGNGILVKEKLDIFLIFSKVFLKLTPLITTPNNPGMHIYIQYI